MGAKDMALRSRTLRGFLLQATYRIESGRPVVHLYGRLEDGKTFLVRDDRAVPHFWVRAADAERARRLGAAPLVDDGRRAMTGEPVVRIDVAVPPDAPPLRDRLLAAGIECYEADVRFAIRYLIERDVRGYLAIDGEPAGPEDARRAGVDRLFVNPEIGPPSGAPAQTAAAAPAVLSFDIETDPQAQKLLAVSLHGCGASEVLLLTPDGASCPDGAVPFGTERDLLEAFCRRVRETDPDVLTGWNVIDFDLSVLAKMAERLKVQFEIGRGPGAVRLRPARGFWGSSEAAVPGRVVLDGINLLRGAFVRMDSYSLDSVSKEVLGEGKVVGHRDRAAEILRMFRDDREKFVAYALTDARLVTEILEKLRLVDLAFERSRLTGMPPDRVSASIASFDFLYLSELTKRSRVAPTVRAPAGSGRPGSEETGDEDGEAVHTTGGHVLEPEPGLYENVLVLDFKSLYPSLIRTFQIDPLGYLAKPGDGDDPIVAPNGAAFRREPGILPRMLDDLFPRREAAKNTGNLVASNAIKILMNSFYGVLGTPACRFHNPDIANAITSFGREMLLWSKARIEDAGLRVLYGDTDSLFMLSGKSAPKDCHALGARLVRDLNRDVAAHVKKTWNVASRLEMEYETLYLRLLLPAVRHGSAGARKRYAGLVERDGGTQVVFTGMEVVRRDWTELAKGVQRGLYERLFRDRPVEPYLKQAVADLRAGRMDEQLVYRKSLRKSLDEYTSTTPPHVAAARKMKKPPRRAISYVMTTAGPEPAAERRSPPDHDHYLQKQIRPVAEPVLSVLGLRFDRVIGDEKQMELF